MELDRNFFLFLNNFVLCARMNLLNFEGFLNLLMASTTVSYAYLISL